MSTSSPIIDTISSTYSVACGTSVGPGDAELAHRLEPHRLALGVISCHGRFSLLARLMILSSMSVMLLTEAHLQTGPLEVAAQHVVDQRRPAVTEVRRAVDRRATQVHAHRAGLAHGELAYLLGWRCRTGWQHVALARQSE